MRQPVKIYLCVDIFGSYLGDLLSANNWNFGQLNLSI